MKKLSAILFTIIMTVCTSSCSDEKGCTDQNAINFNPLAKEDDGSCRFVEGEIPVPDNYIPHISRSGAALIAIKAINTVPAGPLGTVDHNLNYAVAAFNDTTGSNLITAGTVTCEGTELSLRTGTVYTYDVTGNESGISFSFPIEWKATGDAWPAFEVSANNAFPEIGNITSGNIELNEDYTLTTSSASGSDSLLYAIFGQEGMVQVLTSGSNTSYTFSASDLRQVGKGTAVVQVTGLSYATENLDRRDYLLVSQKVRSRVVEVQ